VSVSEYGVLELLNRSQDFMLLIITMGMASTLATLYQMEETREGKLALYSTAIFFLGLTSIVILAPVGLLAGKVSLALFATGDYSLLVVMFLAATYAEIIFQKSALFLQSEVKSGTYVALYSGRAVLSLILNALFAFVLHLGLFGIALATLIHTSLAAVIAATITLRTTKLHFRADRIKSMLRFGLPLVPGALAMFVLNNGDRYFLNAYATKAEVGVYSVGYKLAAATSTLVLVPFLKLWSVRMVEVSRRPDGPKVIGTIATFLTAACMFVTLAMSLFAPYLLLLLANRTYEQSVPIIPIVGLSYVLFAWTVVMDSSFYVTKRTELKPIALLISCAVILPLYVVLIKNYGMMGAAWSTLAGFGTFATVTYIVGQKVYRAEYEFGRMASVLAMAAGTLFLSRWTVGISYLNFGLRLVLVLGFLGIVWVAALTNEERGFAREQFRTVVARF
jgi:O-antigen/teichoic acid export membrane protein